MGCGASASAKEQGELRQTKAKITDSRREADDKELQIQEETDRLVRTVGLRSQEARDVLQLERELMAASAAHTRAVSLQRERIKAEFDKRLQHQLEQAEEEAQQMLQEGSTLSGYNSWQEQAEAFFDEEVAEAEASHGDLVRSEEMRSVCAQEELARARDEVHLLAQERDSEAEAACVTREAFLAEQRAAQRQGEMLKAEVRTQVSETEVLQDSHQGLEDKARSLQQELSKVAYTVGQRDHELKVKDTELQEVRQSISCIQDEMDEVNRQLQEQCGRVQRVEGSLRLSRDLGEKVKAMRDMLKESHGALGQLCSLLEQERSRREHCTQGLKQQRVRTELLLQLLHHFKSRTQELAPQALLSGHVPGPGISEFAGGGPSMGLG
mmetsp:Transcript_18282/g.41349  ORF Transcript_18282/g.41349 Transcript_18282/m.41349 type:complete len:382 (+) Transcript_18282:36-1181(+)|eukprot:CAMPEP_0197915532 /NCGR_PEP_ID=MMETSP1439-20131203/80353_1 /TAXON_ID=66791 /ORGANISM="Gonyaulax spinifera, Strain CCMP409" /LENGTH=381 /DNA_ID=CAMNT_0043537493 /DNA_START=32 /DNA_END=1177 /DNA_ORIENTATION=-